MNNDTPADAIRPEAIEIGQIYADHHSEGEYILSCHEKLVRYANKSLAAQDGLVEALREIASPIEYMQKRAEQDGAMIDGQMAVRLSNDADYLKSIAAKALSAIKGDKS